MYNKNYLKFYLRSLLGRSTPFYSLIFQITNVCNSRCITCFNWRNLNKDKDRELTLEEIKKFTSGLGQLHTVTLGGGEPFLRKDIVEIIKYFETNNKLKVVAIPTNCLLPDIILNQIEKILNNFSGSVKIGLSLDGLFQDHDNIRGVKGNFDNFLKTYNGLAKLKNKYPKLKLRICTTVFGKNTDKIIELLRYVRQNLLAIDFHGLELLKGDYDKNKVGGVDLSKFINIINEIKELNKDSINFSKKIVNPIYYELAVDILKNKKQIIPCRISSFFPVVDAIGNVYPCENRKTIGNLRDYNYDLGKVWQSDEAKTSRKEIKNKECYCAHSCYQANMLLSPKMIIKMIRGKYK